jgi:hypothetical protein
VHDPAGREGAAQIVEEGGGQQEAARPLPLVPPRRREEDVDPAHAALGHERGEDGPRVGPPRQEVRRGLRGEISDPVAAHLQADPADLRPAAGVIEQAVAVIEADLHRDGARRIEEREEAVELGPVPGLLEQPAAPQRAADAVDVGGGGRRSPAIGAIVHYRSPSPNRSAARVAIAMIVICGFTPSDEGTALPSTT